jgi:hypothetical protein
MLTTVMFARQILELKEISKGKGKGKGYWGSGGASSSAGPEEADLVELDTFLNMLEQVEQSKGKGKGKGKGYWGSGGASSSAGPEEADLVELDTFLNMLEQVEQSKGKGKGGELAFVYSMASFMKGKGKGEQEQASTNPKLFTGQRFKIGQEEQPPAAEDKLDTTTPPGQAAQSTA